MVLIEEIYQLLFISSIIFIVYILGDLAIKMYGRFMLNSKAVFVLNTVKKIILWISLGIVLTYLF